ncbi:hypothetical protein MC885_018134, partial [Smutsia gigantea]
VSLSTVEEPGAQDWLAGRTLEEGVKKAGLMAAETELCLYRKKGRTTGLGEQAGEEAAALLALNPFRPEAWTQQLPTGNCAPREVRLLGLALGARG